ncbi:hypothetical protein BCV70DRAFT_50 [Testicularia cyperi]|uniref:Copper transport protein n=1 Tax=Testicularia cyperi TaxID=1882483 RepID=A0A317XX19_9BASI|nr:hypothetical protein BCV70DRAFT_50 [Testicularia cyperi]
MDMDMDTMSSNSGSTANTTSSTAAATANSMMMPVFFHATGGDILWISGFRPTSPAAVLGASVLVFFIALLSRFLDALKRVVQCSRDAAGDSQGKNYTSSPARFSLRADTVVGLVFLVHSGLAYLLMLAVMTGNAYYFSAILIGLGLGETAFGRFGREAGSTSAVSTLS